MELSFPVSFLGIEPDISGWRLGWNRK